MRGAGITTGSTDVLQRVGGQNDADKDFDLFILVISFCPDRSAISL
jgi:hypothetical protein